MVTCKLYGRLGNNMMQMAATMGYAVKYGVPFCFPEKTLNPKEWKRYFTHLPTCNQGVVTARTWKEPSHAYTEIPKLEGKNILLDGYFQSIKYFEHCLDEIRVAFGFKYQMQEGVAGLHIRRGDYLNYPSKHPSVSMPYIDQAIRKMIWFGSTGTTELDAGKIDSIYYCRTIKVFSDDIEWCKKNIPTQIRIPYITFKFSEEQDEVKAFEDYMNCEHQIISNSTFSLMAAILNPNPNKIVISPSKENWFGPGNSNLSTEDIIPDSFIQIKY